MKSFTTAVREQEIIDAREEDAIEFEIDGVMLKAYRPTPSQVAYAMTASSKNSSFQEQIAGTINFFTAVLDEESRVYIVNRLLDGTDPFEIENVQEVISYLMEEWSGRPTKSPSGSTRSRSTGGQKSKPATTKSISSP